MEKNKGADLLMIRGGGGGVMVGNFVLCLLISELYIVISNCKTHQIPNNLNMSVLIL